MSSGVYRAGVGIILRNKEGKVFAGKRTAGGSNEDVREYDLAIHTVQGGIEEGESDEEAMKRELMEEVGLSVNYIEVIAKMPSLTFYDIPDDILSDEWRGKYIGQKHRWFLLDLKPGAQINIQTADPEFFSYEWMEPKEFLKQAIFFKAQAYGDALKFFGLL